uniref:Uncharacterized protein n=2 Tax=Lepeophtheirus salmonis TaxID=72036 RepID=A0A0K2UKV2_LEPSM
MDSFIEKTTLTTDVVIHNYKIHNSIKLLGEQN